MFLALTEIMLELQMDRRNCKFRESETYGNTTAELLKLVLLGTSKKELKLKPRELNY
jgi:hypothetical protein